MVRKGPLGATKGSSDRVDPSNKAKKRAHMYSRILARDDRAPVESAMIQKRVKEKTALPVFEMLKLTRG